MSMRSNVATSVGCLGMPRKRARQRLNNWLWLFTALWLAVGCVRSSDEASPPSRAVDTPAIDNSGDQPAAPVSLAAFPEFNPALAEQLQAMVDADQKARNLWSEDFSNVEASERVGDVDRRNTAAMKDIIARHGWPTMSLVGPDGATNAWLLVQHADQDRAFQKRCLALMTAAAAHGEASLGDLAYLTDRVRLAEGKKQLYGTQIRIPKGEAPRPAPVADPDNLNARRAQMGLSTIEDYLELVR